jgi:hypothetical protein
MQSETLRSAKAAFAAANRRDRNVSPERVEELRRDYTAAKIAEYVRDELSECRPLTEKQINRIFLALHSNQ